MPTLPPLATAIVFGIAAANLVLHIVSVGWFAYGPMSDEFYYLDSTARLGWGYVDHPPLSIAVLKLVRAVLGDSLWALRAVPSLANAGLVVFAGLLAREFGGGRAAQGIAGVSVAAGSLFLGVTSFYSMNALELVLWATAAFLVARIANGADPRHWLALGGVLGLGLLNKISMSWFGLGLGVSLLVTRERRWLATPWPWAAAALAFALFTPHVVWQVQHGWPTLEFMRNATAEKMVAKTPLGFLVDQLVVINVAAPLALAGLAFFFRSGGQRHQAQAWIWLTTCGLLMASGSARSNYLGPAYVALFAGGAVAIEHAARRWQRRWLPIAVAAVLFIGGAASAPMAIPLLPPERFVPYAQALGLVPPVEEDTDMGPLPHHFALRFGWTEMRDVVGRAAATLDDGERERAAIFGEWFGDTGMLNFHGPALGLPPAFSNHNHYWIWGPPPGRGDVLIVLAHDDWIAEHYARVETVAEIGCRWCMPHVARMRVYVAREPRQPLEAIWPALKHYE